MKNNFINNNGANLLHTSKKQNKKTKVEIQSIVGDQSRIEELKNQEQEISKELWGWETKQKKADKLLNYLDEVERFSTKYLAKVLEVERDKENRNNYEFENSIKNASEFVLKFEPAKQAFTNLVFQKIENQVRHLKSQLDAIQDQLSHQERIFARIEARRQGRILLKCKLGYHLGCPGVYQCANCQINYSVAADKNQATEISQ